MFSFDCNTIFLDVWRCTSSESTASRGDHTNVTSFASRSTRGSTTARCFVKPLYATVHPRYINVTNRNCCYMYIGFCELSLFLMFCAQRINDVTIFLKDLRVFSFFIWKPCLLVTFCICFPFVLQVKQQEERRNGAVHACPFLVFTNIFHCLFVVWMRNNKQQQFFLTFLTLWLN